MLFFTQRRSPGAPIEKVINDLQSLADISQPGKLIQANLQLSLLRRTETSDRQILRRNLKLPLATS